MKKTIFKGTVNGETFTDVQAYNKRVTELLAKGESISAETSTETVEVEETSVPTCACEEIVPDTMVNYFPYFDDEDPHYLDLLVTDNPETNAEARKEAKDVCEQSFSLIVNTLYDDAIGRDEIEEYLDDVRDVLSVLRNDAIDNAEAVAKVTNAMAETNREFEAIRAKYEKTLDILNSRKQLLTAATPIISDFTEFYGRIEAEAMNALVEKRDETEECCSCETCPTCGKCKCECTCDCSDINKNKPVDKILCNVKEVSPQQLSDVSDWFDKVLEACGLSRF